jgi:deferrochelatase/peroxidase EfeB
MGNGSVAQSIGPIAGSWQLRPEHGAMTQGLVVSPFEHLPHGQALFLGVPKGGAWLAALDAEIPITDASPEAKARAKQQAPSAAIAFTWTGLESMGLDGDTLASFSVAFREGMHQTDRRRRLRDDLPEMVMTGGPAWSGNTVDVETRKPGITTRVSVHAVLLLYAADDETLKDLVKAAEAILQGNGGGVVHRLPLLLDTQAGQRREHFGFADGVSQPVPYGLGIAPPHGSRKDRWHAISAGDILMGHVDGHGEPAPGPFIHQALDSRGLLPRVGAPEGFRNLGLNGTYLVIRELRQNVDAFWKSMKSAADAAAIPGADKDWLAARVIGRTRDGDPLCPGGVLPPVVDRQGSKPANDFGYMPGDQHGIGCPLGSHIRRANPRDGLAPTPADGADLVAAVNHHRILRRGRKFGPLAYEPANWDRGLLFMCINTDIVRQFEFIQQTWCLNPAFATLFDETDPLIGPKGKFTIPIKPLRARADVDTFVKLAGGEYFFLPSIPSLKYLATLLA